MWKKIKIILDHLYKIVVLILLVAIANGVNDNIVKDYSSVLSAIKNHLMDIESYVISIDSGIYTLEENSIKELKDIEESLWSIENNGINLK